MATMGRSPGIALGKTHSEKGGYFMNQLSLFPDRNPADKLWYKVRLSNYLRRSCEDEIHSFPTEQEAQDRLDEWVNAGKGNSGYIYRERLSHWISQEDHHTNAR